jgi:hypothetical protein
MSKPDASGISKRSEVKPIDSNHNVFTNRSRALSPSAGVVSGS